MTGRCHLHGTPAKPTCGPRLARFPHPKKQPRSRQAPHHAPTPARPVELKLGIGDTRPGTTMMPHRRGCSGTVLFAVSILLAAAVVPEAAGFHLGGDESGLVRGMLAAIREQAEAEDAARFAVAEHNKNQGSALEFARVVDAKRQVVAGTLHDLILEVVDAGKKSLYKAKVWVKPWQDFKAVVEFRHAGDSESEFSIASDDSTGQDIHGMTVYSFQERMEHGKVEPLAVSNL